MNRSGRWLVPLSLLATLAVIVLAVGNGSVYVPPADILATFGKAVRGEALVGSEVIVWQMRPEVATPTS